MQSHLQADGIMVRVIEKISTELKLKPSYTFLNSGRCRQGVASGSFDLYPYGDRGNSVEHQEYTKNILIAQYSIFTSFPVWW